MKLFITSFYLSFISSAFSNEMIFENSSGTAKVVLNSEEVAVIAGHGSSISLEVGENVSTTVIWSPGGDYVCISSEIKRGSGMYLVGVVGSKAKEIHFEETSFGSIVSTRYSSEYTLGRIMMFAPLKWQNDKQLVIRLTGTLKEKNSGEEKWYDGEIILNFEASKCSIGESRWEKLSNKQ